MFTSNQRDYINNRAPNASKYRKESESNTRSAWKEVKNAFRENANLRNEICRIRSNTRIRMYICYNYFIETILEILIQNLGWPTKSSTNFKLISLKKMTKDLKMFLEFRKDKEITYRGNFFDKNMIDLQITTQW